MGNRLSRIRLFETENDHTDVEECVTEDGRQACLHIDDVVGDLLAWASGRNYNLRDFENLALSKLQMAVARAIIMRRKKEERK